MMNAFTYMEFDLLDLTIAFCIGALLGVALGYFLSHISPH